ncbi:helix-turn-helix domain-containing protein [Kribbella sp. NPDC048928]|uniref:helix-turn-helix domain-containing protein n=1 Tax=Kribbella sp. NPDC048928 TaxID=3364111 RepID=UPI00371ADA6D
MPRTESDLDPTTGPVAEFASYLRNQRKRAGITYRELAARTVRPDTKRPYSHAHMVRAAKGDELPSWPVAKAYLVGCGISSPRFLRLWEALWDAANSAVAAIKDPDHGNSGSLQHVTTLLGFGEHLRALSERSGLPTLRALEDKTGIPKSTLSEWFKGQRLPTAQRLYDFAEALGTTPKEQTELWQVRDRLAHGDEDSTRGLLNLLREQFDRTSPTQADETWRIARSMFQAGEQRLHNDRVLVGWAAGHSSTMQVSDGRHRASSRTALDAARERAEHLARRLEANRSRAIEAEAELVEAIELLETLKLQKAI